ncbi:hypothetical protein Gogos_010207, partial [Gossypium gossypioides]|nr:hypothetical protein [Gossypium gossypioides]
MTGEMIQTKAKELLLKMYDDANSEFNFSIGWLERFKTRHGIKSYRRFSESGSIIMKNIEYALPQIRAKLKIFYSKDIYSMDETGLFYRLQAYHSLARKQLEGRKKDKERLTVVVCCNGDGSDKVPLWVIGKFANLIRFKHVNIDNLSCHYQANKTAWMIGLLFKDFVRWFDARMTADKIYYQRRFYSNILERYEKREINPEKTNVLDAIPFINVAWNIDVKPTTIANCFRHCKIRSEEDMPLEQEIGDAEGIHKLKEQDPDDSSVLPHVSLKEAFLVVDTLKNYLIQKEKNIPDLVYALLKVKDEI